ncbi:MAG: thiamine pyrophosphate-dependent enzyme [Bdellovibrionales bacterium]|jgi:2-oxoisovalerate dehydrogenase E1 component alpha subunit|nr:thiamine pyrophosphate-dependent enzyme [Bdellovibrionales bacterium]
MSKAKTGKTNAKAKAMKATVGKAGVGKTKSKAAAPKTGAVKGAGGKDRALGLLPKELVLNMFDLMVKSRVLEERLIKVYKTGDAFFWIGAPGEEAFGVPLGLLVKKGQGPSHDYLHLHYRGTPTLIAMGMPMIDSIRLIMNRATDRSTGGRNFANHYCFPEMNVVPVGSPIEVQYGMAVGTAIAQRRRKMKGEESGVSIVTGGDAGTAEGDFASALIWASRPGAELPVYLTVQNNKWGISTGFDSQHGEKYIADRGKAFGMRTNVVNGNDPIESYFAISQDLEYIRKNTKPVLTEFAVSRLYGHSSASGANREAGECPIELFEKRLVDSNYIRSDFKKELWEQYDRESREAAELVRTEAGPTGDTIWDHVYVGNENADWRKF